MTLHAGLAAIIAGCGVAPGSDGIYSGPMASAPDQEVERRLREEVAGHVYDNYLEAIAQSHSIPVMDAEVDRLLAMMPRGAVILDIGGCWGWHWRRLAATRPDVGVLIVDFVRANLSHAERVLGPLVGSQVALMHADATALPFPSGDPARGFDTVWTVQVFQHIPDYARACREAHRVLKTGGRFVTYSLHSPSMNRAIYRLLGRPFHLEGMVEGRFYLARANDRQRQIVADLFGGAVVDRYSEWLFHPNLKLSASGAMGSLLGRLDARLGSGWFPGRWLARQRSFEATKG
jgi:ubiquinone/menaquinone biosynthesis C-methylase UbiE